MIEHISLMVKNYEESRRFYDETLSILGYERLMNFEDASSKVCGYGKEGKPAFWISFEESPSRPEEKIGLASGFHVAFSASSKQDVEDWHKKALELAGKDNGLPGYRVEYYPGYYAAFIMDPNGWRLEALYHDLSKI